MPTRESRFACPCATDDDVRSSLGLYATRALVVLVAFLAGVCAEWALGTTLFTYTVTGPYPSPCEIAAMQDSINALTCTLTTRQSNQSKEYVRALEYGPSVDIWGNETAWECTNRTVHTDCLVDALCDTFIPRRANDLTCALLRAKPFSMTLHDCVGRGRIGCDDVAIRALGPVVPSGFVWPTDTGCAPGLPRIDRLVSRAISRRLRCVDDANATVTCAAVDGLRVAWRVVSRRTKY